MLATRVTVPRSAESGAPDLQPVNQISESLAGIEIEEPQTSEAFSDPVNWQGLVERIHGGDESGMEELYRLFGRGIRYYLCRQLGHQELDDKVHDTFVIVVQAIRRGELREPERLMGFVRTVVRRQVAAYIDDAVHSRRDELNLDLGIRVADRRNNPEQSAAFRQKVAFMLEVLGALSERDREILTRFYLDEQSQETICCEMVLTETQFRLLKSRAKARFGEIGKRKLQQKTTSTSFFENFCPLNAPLIKSSCYLTEGLFRRVWGSLGFGFRGGSCLNTCCDSHVPDELLEKYALGSASTLEVASLEGHVLLCTDCQTHLAEMDEYIAVIRAALMEVTVDIPVRISAQPALAL